MASSGSVDLQFEEEETVTLKASEIPSQSEITNKCLIGKLFSDKSQVHATITAVLYNIWRKPKGFCCEEVEGKIYRFYFDNEFDACMTLQRQPWNYKGQLLVLKRWEKGQDLAAYDFDHVPFSVQVWGIPWKFRTATIGKKLCSHAGSVLEVGMYSVRDIHGFIPRAMVLIDVSKPLKRGAFLDTVDYGKVWAYFKYEKLPAFCYYCGRIGHEDGGCSYLIKDKMKNNVRAYKYGPALKADRIRKIIDDSDEGQNKQYQHQNQRLMLKNDPKMVVDQVSQHLSSLSISEKDHKIGHDHEPSLAPQVQTGHINVEVDSQDATADDDAILSILDKNIPENHPPPNEAISPTLIVENLLPGLLKFNLGGNPSPFTKNKKKVKETPHPSISTPITVPIHQAPPQDRVVKKRSLEINEHREGKRACVDDS